MTIQIDDVAVQKVLKVKLERSLLDFTKYFFLQRFGSKFIENWHHGAILERLEAVYNGEIQNLIINLPPGGTKTEMVSINFPAWCMAMEPYSRFLHLSYSSELAALNSQSCRDIVQSHEYQTLWGREVADDSKAKNRWNIMEKDRKAGGMYATSSGGQVTGFRAGYMKDGFNGAIIIDDPMKPEDVEHENQRKSMNRTLSSTIRSRRAKPTTPIIVVMQRLHPEDTSGFLLEDGIGEKFEHLNIPAIMGQGETLRSYWDFKEPLEQLQGFQAKQPYIFGAQYMQEPAPEEGNYFLKEMFGWYEDSKYTGERDTGGLPVHIHKYGASDYAVSDGKGDFTVHGVMAVDPNEDIYICDWWRGQTLADAWIEQRIDMVERHKPLAWAEESGQIKSSLEPFIVKRQSERGVFCHRVKYTRKADKTIVARSIQARASQRKIYLPKNAPWVQNFLKEMLQFPNATNDDQVDVMALFGLMLAGLKPGQLPKPQHGKPKPEGITINDLYKLKSRMEAEKE